MLGNGPTTSDRMSITERSSDLTKLYCKHHSVDKQKAEGGMSLKGILSRAPERRQRLANWGKDGWPNGTLEMFGETKPGKLEVVKVGVDEMEK